MLIREHNTGERRQYIKREHAIQQDVICRDSIPCFLTQAWGWVEFRRIALGRQLHYLSADSDKDACEPLAEEQFALLL